MEFTTLELCAGGGGQALGLEMAGFAHSGVVEYEAPFCNTLRANRPAWNVLNKDIRDLDGTDFDGVDLVAGGVPCPPFSTAGKQLGADDERDMFPAALEIIRKAKPRAVMLENVQGLAAAKFSDYRNDLLTRLHRLGYVPEWKVLQASDFGVPQLRPRFILVALKKADAARFRWPAPVPEQRMVGETLHDLMASGGWKGAGKWAAKAHAIAPTIVGGSKKHGGPDLGPTRAKKQWLELGVDGMGIANEVPSEDFPENGIPRLTVRMAARIQGFPDSWAFEGKKTNAYRQVGNAFPPPVARAVGISIITSFSPAQLSTVREFELETRLLEDPLPYHTSCPPKKVRKH